MIQACDVFAGLPTLKNESVQCCVTSPPYFGLRDYGVVGQIGLEATPEEYVSKLIRVLREVRRVLKRDGVLWLNLGDSYAAKDLIGIPWRVAFALQADGWYLRSDIVWSKPNPMPESVRDRPTKAHEYVFLLSKSKRYLYDADAIKEPAGRAKVSGPNSHCNVDRDPAHLRYGSGNLARRLASGEGSRLNTHLGYGVPWQDDGGGRNKRSVWTICAKPFKEAHFAVMPEALVTPCILAGSAPGSLVLDPFAGAGTVGVVALRHGRRFVGFDLNPAYAAMGNKRIEDSLPLLRSTAGA